MNELLPRGMMFLYTWHWEISRYIGVFLKAVQNHQFCHKYLTLSLHRFLVLTGNEIFQQLSGYIGFKII